MNLKKLKKSLFAITFISASILLSNNLYAINGENYIANNTLKSQSIKSIEGIKVDVISSSTVKRAEFKLKEESENNKDWFNNIYEIKHGYATLKKSKEDNFNTMLGRTFYLDYPFIKLEGTLGIIDYGENKYIIKSKGYEDLAFDYNFEKAVKINAKIKGKYSIDKDVYIEINSDIDPNSAILFYSLNRKPIYNDKVRLEKIDNKTFLVIDKSLLKEGNNILEIITNVNAPMENVDLEINVGSLQKLKINQEVNPIDAGSVILPEEVFEEDKVKVDVDVKENYEFLNYTINGEIVSENSEYVFIVKEDLVIVANFKKLEEKKPEEKEEPEEENKEDKEINSEVSKKSLNKKRKNRLKKNNIKEKEEIDYLYKEKEVKNNINLLKGYSDGTFKPDNNITIAEIISIFAQIENKNIENKNFNSKYKDVNSRKWYSNSIYKLEELGYLDEAFKGENLNPNKYISRAEFSSIAANFIESSNENSNFKDVDENHISKKSIDKLYSKNYIKGYLDGTFKPDNNISRAEVATILNRMLEINSKENIENLENKYSDLDKNHWAYYEILSISK
ncbi:S-layer homology domain-containing protein [Peptoniphilus stercorisuis]|uniref:SLH domain-containing protein n=1 Tax=Peptoniphilus stercorisuis TaxID=1436965 RepID=A0ABS4KEM3_9FIRM|nr:S-layer homology domain-containing protein [Peptoniphilus stercorisuis]MBP2026195.1 hypothetical protein [Peptoniphilus stercorisuis]